MSVRLASNVVDPVTPGERVVLTSCDIVKLPPEIVLLVETVTVALSERVKLASRVDVGDVVADSERTNVNVFDGVGGGVMVGLAEGVGVGGGVIVGDALKEGVGRTESLTEVESCAVVVMLFDVEVLDAADSVTEFDSESGTE